MIIANTDAFKSWVQKKVSPITDADPSTLARYVAALIKKDKPESDLKDVCLQELNIFLLENTEQFVEALFHALRTQSYLIDDVVPDSTVADTAQVKQDQSVDGPKEICSTSSTEQRTTNRMAMHDKNAMIPDRSAPSRRRTESRRSGRSSSRDEEKNNTSRSRRSSSRDEVRNSSLRSGRSLSKDEGSHRGSSRRLHSDDRHNPVFNRLGYSRRSPDRSYHEPRRRPSNRDSYNHRPSPVRSHRSMQDVERRFRGRSRSRTRSRTRSRSPRRPVREHSLSKPYRRSRSIEKSVSPPRLISVVSSVVRASKDDDRDQLERDRSPSSDGRDESDYRITVPLDVLNVSTNPEHCTLWPAPPPAKPRCQDFDEKGFCLRGDLCPFDHGSDPVVVDDVLLPPPPLPQYQAHQPVAMPHLSQQRPSLSHVVPFVASNVVGTPGSALHVPVLTSAGSRNSATILPQPPMLPTIPPSNSLTVVSALPELHLPPSYHPTPTSLQQSYSSGSVALCSTVSHEVRPSGDSKYSIPMDTSSSGGAYTRRVVEAKSAELPVSQSTSEPSLKIRRVFDRSRLGAKVEQLKSGDETASLIVESIPPAQNTITDINEQFSKFGVIVSVQLCYNGRNDSALVTFAKSSEALAAYQSTEPLFNNRFINLRWLDTASSGPLSVETEPNRLSAKERLGLTQSAKPNSSVHSRLGSRLSPMQTNSASDSKSIVLSHSGAITRTFMNSGKPLTVRNATASVEDRFQRLNLQKKTSKDPAKMKLEILRQKQMLMKRQIEKQKSLLSLVENPNTSSSDKAVALKMLKNLAISVEKLKSELSLQALSLKQSSQPSDAGAAKKVTVQSPTDTASLTTSLAYQDPVKAKRLVLDVELELIAKQNKGETDTTELDRKVSVLKYQATNLGLFRPAVGLHGRPPSVRGRGRGRGYFAVPNKWSSQQSVPFRSSAVDHRPKDITVSGFTENEKEAVVAYFRMFGGSLKSSDVPSGTCVISFETRQQAEYAVSQAANFNVCQLTVAWYQPSNNLSRSRSQPDELPIDEEPVVVQVAAAEADDDEDEFGPDTIVVEQLERREENLFDTGGELCENDYDEDALLGADDDDDGVILD